MSFASGVGRLALAAALLSCVGFTLVQAASPQAAQIKPRQDKLRDMGGALKAITDELKKPKVDWDNVIIPNTQTIKDQRLSAELVSQGQRPGGGGEDLCAAGDLAEAG